MIHEALDSVNDGTATAELRSASIHRGRRLVLSDVTFAVQRGCFMHVRGSNGSGKTSLLRALAGLSAVRSGSVRHARSCGYVPEKVNLTPSLSCIDWLRAMRSLRGLPAIEWSESAASSGLDPAALHRTSRQLSKGMLQRIALLEALAANVALLLLDEPFAGLDGDGRDWLATSLSPLRGSMLSVMVTDHSGAVATHTHPSDILDVHDGTASLRCSEPSEPAAVDVVTIRVARPTGERHVHHVAAGDSDALLGRLLVEGWHVEQVGVD